MNFLKAETVSSISHVQSTYSINVALFLRTNGEQHGPELGARHMKQQENHPGRDYRTGHNGKCVEIRYHRVGGGSLSLEVYKDRNRKTDFVLQAVAAEMFQHTAFVII